METNTTPFEGMPKIARLNREIIVTEKIDGTNAQVFIGTVRDEESNREADPTILGSEMSVPGFTRVLRAGSKSRWLTRKQDNFGFAKWVDDNQSDLFNLGDGRHLGEWWGSGVQRGYGLEKGEKRFSLFNTGRWFDQHTFDPGAPCPQNGDVVRRIVVAAPGLVAHLPTMEQAPACCRVVPTLYRGPFDQEQINLRLYALAERGSMAAPGFMKPEGVVVFHTAARQMFKVTIEKDESPKGAA